MVLTNAPRKPSARDSFPTLQLFILAICRVAEPIALASCFPYAWVMVKNFHLGDESSASFYTGLFISAFSFSESLTGMFWGCLSDRVGRKPVLLVGCGGTMLSMLIVGFATNFWVALAGRALGGLLNGNIGVIQTMVGELVHKPEHERTSPIPSRKENIELKSAARAYAVMPFVWSIGTIIGPAIGGMFANPSVSLPSLVSADGLFATFPYLLPNLICAALLLVSILAGFFLLVETHPDLQAGSTQDDWDHTAAETPLMATAGATADPGVDLRADSYGTFNTVKLHENKQWRATDDGLPISTSVPSSSGPKFLAKRVVMIVIALGIFTYHCMTYDHLLPIFLQDERKTSISILSTRFFDISGGLGMTTRAVGIIMSVNGVIALFIQAIIFPIFAAWLGIWKLFIVVTLLHPIDYFMMPYLAFLPEGLLYPGIWICLTVRNFTSILAYPLLLILLKEASPSSSVLGKINGLAASAAAACRTIAPPFAGYLYSLGAQQGFPGLAWWGSGVVAIVGAVQAFWVDREKDKTATVRSVVTCFAPTLLTDERDEMIHIEVNDAEV